jgi:hypothetical protein
VTLVAFDLIELQADDLRDEPLEQRKQRLAKLLARGGAAITYSEHLSHEGAAVFDNACRLGLEGIVSKRLDAPYRSGPSKTWLKSKNPLSEAVRREREEDWRRNIENSNTWSFKESGDNSGNGRSRLKGRSCAARPRPKLKQWQRPSGAIDRAWTRKN